MNMLWSLINSVLGGPSADEKATLLKEAPSNNVSLEELTKEELDALGAQHGIKLDRRKKKSTLIRELNENNIFHK